MAQICLTVHSVYYVFFKKISRIKSKQSFWTDTKVETIAMLRNLLQQYGLDFSQLIKPFDSDRYTHYYIVHHNHSKTVFYLIQWTSTIYYFMPETAKQSLFPNGSESKFRGFDGQRTVKVTITFI